MRTIKRFSAVSATFAPTFAEQGIKIELIGLRPDGERIQAEPKRIQRAQEDQTELGGRFPCLDVGSQRRLTPAAAASPAWVLPRSCRA